MIIDLSYIFKNGNVLPPDEDDCLENEEEYDALNDETFGALEDASSIDDWEQQHEQFAEIAENSKHSENIENSISQLVLDESEDHLSLSSSVWSYNPTSKNGDIFNPSNILSSLQKASKSFHPIQNTRMPPPGLPPMGIPPPGLRHLPPQMNPHQSHHHPMLPPGLVRMVPPPHTQFMPTGGPPRPPGFMYPPGSSQAQFPVNHPFNFPPPPRNLNSMLGNSQQQRNHHHQQHSPQQLHHQHLQQRLRHDSGGYRQQQKENQDCKDEYSELMSMREKQWLLNIQMLQLNTGTPYFDDYYYTIFKERKSKNKENFSNDRSMHYPNKRQHRNSDRQENQTTLTPRVYTPLQFENSLGKLQCGSVTAPRKIIDMDIVTPDKDGDSPQVPRDTRKTKQLLLELEALYALLLKAEDIKNPLLRELELAPTPEQKQEVLRLFKLESEPIVENQYDYIIKIVLGLVQEDKFSSFLNIRKGKMLVLRLLPHLTTDSFACQLLELWTRVLLSLPIVGRRDTAGDNILPKLYPFFKKGLDQ
ncbi:hypothetical protein NQ314_021450 [Rhamnusium bicolor]|uniref:Uncharacterized protein n=1 Tax=Rhamnusium bicolor TaxID=1586634 RepID=A0AAV8WI71_9CUCU|nr:hypothetical protein NQ314_021450 [Rhamnusium bicolor]